jgi:hypothetical protein
MGRLNTCTVAALPVNADKIYLLWQKLGGNMEYVMHRATM